MSISHKWHWQWTTRTARKSLWSLGNDTAKNVAVFATDNSLSASSDSKNNILILGEDTTSDINSSFGSQEKKD